MVKSDGGSVRGFVFLWRSLFVRGSGQARRGAVQAPEQASEAFCQREVDGGSIGGVFPLDEVADSPLNEEAVVSLELLSELEVV